MKRNIKGTCLCIALASAMVFANSGQANAADADNAEYNTGAVCEIADSSTGSSIIFTGEASYTIAAADSAGYNRPESVVVLTDLKNGAYGDSYYEVFRSTKKAGGYKKIYTGYEDVYNHLEYRDQAVSTGTTYYYKFRVIGYSDDADKKPVVLGTSGAIAVRAGSPAVGAISAESKRYNNGRAVGINISITGDFANRYDIYRSASKYKGYRKIKTIYGNSYFDKSVKKGNIYYYKAIPKYYDPATKKTITGKTSAPAAARFIMDIDDGPKLVQTDTTALRCTWSSGGTSDVSYEVWIKRADIEGDAYRKVGVTKKRSYTITKLSARGTYSVKIRTVRKSGKAVKYEDSAASVMTMGYTSVVQELGCYTGSSAVSADNNTLAVNYKLTWRRDWGASGYIVTAYNNYTGRRETIKKITSGKTTSYVFRQTSSRTNGVKYTDISVKPYKGSKAGTNSIVYASGMPAVKKVKAARKTGSTSIVKWTGVKGASLYYIYRSTELGIYQLVGASTTTSFIDRNVSNGYRYTYTVAAVTDFAGMAAGEQSAYANYVHKLAAPTIGGIASPAKGTAALRWNKIPNARTYLVYRSDKKNGGYKLVARTSSVTYTDRKLAAGKAYYYKVVAGMVNGGGRTVKSAASQPKGVRIRK